MADQIYEFTDNEPKDNKYPGIMQEYAPNPSVKNADWALHAYIPLSIFNNDSLSSLETITKYIKEEFGLNYRQTAFILKRDERTIWGAYQSSQKSMQQRFFKGYSKFHIPINIFQDRILSVLESLVEYLKENLNLRYCEIAALLNRDDRTIWTVYSRAKKKRRRENVK